MIQQHYIDELLARVEIVSLIDQRVKLKKMGKNYTACCPFHDEKSPSFTVSEQKQFYYCFGCGASGNAIGFLIDYERLTFPESVKKLAMMCGMSEPDKSTREEIIAAEEKRLQKELADERLLVEIGNAMIASGEQMLEEEVKRHDLAKKKVLQIRNAIYELRN